MPADRKWRTLKFRFFVTRDILVIFAAVQLVHQLSILSFIRWCSSFTLKYEGFYYFHILVDVLWSIPTQSEFQNMQSLSSSRNVKNVMVSITTVITFIGRLVQNAWVSAICGLYEVISEPEWGNGKHWFMLEYPTIVGLLKWTVILIEILVRNLFNQGFFHFFIFSLTMHSDHIVGSYTGYFVVWMACICSRSPFRRQASTHLGIYNGLSLLLHLW